VEITIRATDSGGLYVEDTFLVTVGSLADSVGGGVKVRRAAEQKRSAPPIDRCRYSPPCGGSQSS